MAIVFSEIILVVIPVLKEIQISAFVFIALIGWKLVIRITTTSVFPVVKIEDKGGDVPRHAYQLPHGCTDLLVDCFQHG